MDCAWSSSPRSSSALSVFGISPPSRTLLNPYDFALAQPTSRPAGRLRPVEVRDPNREVVVPDDLGHRLLRNLRARAPLACPPVRPRRRARSGPAPPRPRRTAAKPSPFGDLECPVGEHNCLLRPPAETRVVRDVAECLHELGRGPSGSSSASTAVSASPSPREGPASLRVQISRGCQVIAARAEDIDRLGARRSSPRGSALGGRPGVEHEDAACSACPGRARSSARCRWVNARWGRAGARARRRG